MVSAAQPASLSLLRDYEPYRILPKVWKPNSNKPDMGCAFAKEGEPNYPGETLRRGVYVMRDDHIDAPDATLQWYIIVNL